MENIDNCELWLGPVTVRSGCSTDLFVTAPIDFQPESLLIERDVARDCLVTDIKCGRNSQLISTGALPGLLFSNDGLIERFWWDRLKKGDRMIVSVTNQSTIDQVFSAKVRGTRDVKVRKSVGPGRHALGYGSTQVDMWANINVQPQLSFVPDRLVVPSSIRDDFEIKEIFYVNDGVREEIDFSSSGQSFAEFERGRLSCKKPVLTSSFLTIVVRNISVGPRNFQAAILGFEF